MSIAFTGDDADFPTAVAVENRTTEHLLDKCPFVGLQDFGGGDDGVRTVTFQTAPLDVSGKEDRSPSIGLNNARPITAQCVVEMGEGRFRETTGVQPQRIPQ